MARIKCNCGEILSNSNTPEIEFDIYNLNEWSNIADKAEKEPFINVQENLLTFWKCTNCNRLIIFESGNDTPIKIYKLETENRKEWYPQNYEFKL